MIMMDLLMFFCSNSKKFIAHSAEAATTPPSGQAWELGLLSYNNHLYRI